MCHHPTAFYCSEKWAKSSSATVSISLLSPVHIVQQQQQQQPFYGPLCRTTRVSQYRKKHSPTHTYHSHQLSYICFLHLLRSIASSLFNLCAWQSFCTTCLQVLFGIFLGLGPFTLHTFLHPVTHTAILWLCGFCPGQAGWAVTRRNIHSLTPIVIVNHPLSASSIYYDPWHPPCWIHIPHSVVKCDETVSWCPCCV